MEYWKAQLVETTNGWLLDPKAHQRTGVKHTVWKVIPHTSMGREETPCKLGRSTPWYFELKWMSCDRSSLNKQWFEFELALYNIHSAATWRKVFNSIVVRNNHSPN